MSTWWDRRLRSTQNRCRLEVDRLQGRQSKRRRARRMVESGRRSLIYRFHHPNSEVWGLARETCNERVHEGSDHVYVCGTFSVFARHIPIYINGESRDGTVNVTSSNPSVRRRNRLTKSPKLNFS